MEPLTHPADDLPDTFTEPTVNIFTSAPSQNNPEPPPPADTGTVSLILSVTALIVSLMSAYQASQHAQRSNDPTPNTQRVVDMRK